MVFTILYTSILIPNSELGITSDKVQRSQLYLARCYLFSPYRCMSNKKTAVDN